jgi:separase
MIQLKKKLLSILDHWQHKRNNDVIPDAHLILVLDKHAHRIPWESLPSLRPQSVSRVPSVPYLRSALERSQMESMDGVTGVKADCSSAFYVLNPSQDLMHTQQEFAGWLKKYILTLFCM